MLVKETSLQYKKCFWINENSSSIIPMHLYIQIFLLFPKEGAFFKLDTFALKNMIPCSLIKQMLIENL